MEKKEEPKTKIFVNEQAFDKYLEKKTADSYDTDHPYNLPELQKKIKKLR